MNKGFTLVELAIVMTIIGLLIGGILKGQALLENAQVSSTISQVQSYDAAVTSFRDIYSSFPGDTSRATLRLPNCNTASSCENGDDSGIVGVSSVLWGNVDTTMESENTQAWKHLSMANLISGVEPSAGTREWGRTHPTAKIGGGFMFKYAQGNVSGQLNAHVLLLGNDIAGGASFYPVGTAPTSPKTAANIDRKTDDGRPYSGKVQAVSSYYVNGCNWNFGGQRNWYDETVTKKSCDMYFILGG